MSMSMLKNFNINLEYKGNILHINNVNIINLAKEFSSPLYIYSYDALQINFLKYQNALSNIKHLICFAVKTNYNSRILKEFKELGAGFDTVSMGEIYKAINIGVDPKKIVYAGVGKTDEEIKFAIENNILMFNVESVDELNQINEIAAKLNKVVNIAFRVNPDVDPKTHHYISTGLAKNKFGIDINIIPDIYKYAKNLKNINPNGIHCHIGSQLLDLSPYKEVFKKIINLFNTLKSEGINIDYINIGGGLGICYDNNKDIAPDPKDLIDENFSNFIKNNNITLILEPGRSLIGNAGILLTKVIYQKQNKLKNFIIVDAGMNDLIRPSLYGAYHNILPVKNKNSNQITADIVGPICESGDFLAKDKEIQKPINGDYLVALSAGAYAFSMSSNYNSRMKPAEVLIKDEKAVLIRKRESLKDLLTNEII